MDTTPAIPMLIEQLSGALRQQSACMATAESCTGGMIAAACTDVSGSSEWFDRGFVTYSNNAKTDMLGVDPTLLAQHGAVSEPVAAAMAAGARLAAKVSYAVAVTGVAGPTGGSADKPVGTVWFGWATPAGVSTERMHFDGDRQAIRQATVKHALSGLLLRVRECTPQ